MRYRCKVKFVPYVRSIRFKIRYSVLERTNTTTDTVHILDARITLFEHQVNRVKRNLNYLIRKLKNWVRHEGEETPEDELLRLRTAVLHIANRIGDIYPEGLGHDESESD